MACGSCGARARQRANIKYEWTDGTNVVLYDTEIEAKAKVYRKGGSYKPVRG